MKINVHTHVFNLKSALTTEAARVFLSRLKSRNLPTYLATPLRSFLNSALTSGVEDSLTDESALASLLQKVAKHKDFQKYSGKALGNELAQQLEKLIPVAEPGQSLDILKLVFTAIVKSGSSDAEKDANERTISDFLDFLRVNLLSSIDAVTDDLLEQSGPTDVLVALPMDIIDEKASKRDRSVYPKQLEDTIRQTFRYPGRILPFVNVNPRRGSNAYTIFTESVESGKCVGVKLYPSLGYDIDSAKMRTVYATCEKLDIPVLLHCNSGGFRRSAADAKRCDPNHWQPVLSKFKELKVCFGHFGGDEHFVSSSIPAKSWTDSILSMMKSHPGQVFADVAYHTAPMEDAAAKKKYQTNLKAILADTDYRSQVLWGTDYHLVRQQVQDKNYIRYFEKLLTKNEMHRISVDNPRKYLGLPDSIGAGSKKNIKRHISFLNKNRAKVTGAPAVWLSDVLAVSKLPLLEVLAPLNWHRNNMAHNWLTYFIWSKDLTKTEGFPVSIPISLRKNIATKYASGSDDLFHALGQLRMGELSFHFDNPGTDNQELVATRAFISNLHRVLVSKKYGKAKTKASLKASKVRDTLLGVALKKDATVSNLGNAVDSLYNFPIS